VSRQLALEYPTKRVCQALGVPRSSYYYQPKPTDDQSLTNALREVAGRFPTYGYRRLTAQLRREGQQVNTKRVRRLMKQMGLVVKVEVRRKRTTNSDHAYPRFKNLVQNLSIEQPDQVWCSDITYVRLRNGFVYLAVIMDVFTRCIRGWHLSRHLDGDLTLTALKRALSQRTPAIHHSDQGVQYAATHYVKTLQTAGVQVSMAAVGQPTENGYAERLMRTIKEEEVDLSEYKDYQDAFCQIGRFLDDVYQTKRIHSALGYLTPAEFDARVSTVK
jgi:putative transposase